MSVGPFLAYIVFEFYPNDLGAFRRCAKDCQFSSQRTKGDERAGMRYVFEFRLDSIDLFSTEFQNQASIICDPQDENKNQKGLAEIYEV